MATSEDKKYFEVLNETFAAPIFFFLSIFLFCMTIVTILNAGHHSNYIVLGCLLFVLSYNAFRFGKKLKA